MLCPLRRRLRLDLDHERSRPPAGTDAHGVRGADPGGAAGRAPGRPSVSAGLPALVS